MCIYRYVSIVRHLIPSLHCRFENIQGIWWLQPRQTKLMFQVKCCIHHNLWGSEGSKQSRWSSYKAVGMSAWQLFKFQQFKQSRAVWYWKPCSCYITKVATSQKSDQCELQLFDERSFKPNSATNGSTMLIFLKILHKVQCQEEKKDLSLVTIQFQN